MRTLCIVTLAGVLLVAGLGLYMQWFTFSTTSGTDHSQVQLNVDKEKIRQDVNKMKEQARELGQEATKKVDSALHQ